MEYSVQRLILDFSVVPVVIASIIGVVRFRRLDQALRYLTVLTLCALAVEIVARTLLAHGKPNLFLAPIDTTIEFTLLALVYRRTLRPAALSRYMPAIVGAFVLGSLLTYSPRLDTAEFSPIQRFIESLLVLTFVLLFFYREITRKVVLARLEREPLLWVSTGLLLYFSGNILIFLSSNYVLHLSHTLSLNVWTIHALLYIFLNILYSVALCINPRRHV
ncbi:hypothetical protein [Hymenobacter terricola]|uniref:hypothetical protein n=1 Tax=Hymenobacter terricola TaxID=2819236 RepID=UPI001B315A01|nr:hypothetical protein [Hymenobacter terricola]